MKTTLLATIVGLGLVSFAITRAEGKRASPHEEVHATIGGRKVTVVYGRPFKKGREIFG